MTTDSDDWELQKDIGSEAFQLTTDDGTSDRLVA